MTAERRITRRSLLGGVAAASLLRPAAGLASTVPRTVSSRWLGPLEGASGEILAPRQFSLAGMQWRRPADARIELRARALDGTWSPWVAASVGGHGPDGPATPGHFGESLWTGAARAVQLRSSGPVEGVRVHFVSVRAATTGLAASALPLAQPVLDAGPGQPPVIARSAWARGARPAVPPSYGGVELAFVHHTENPNFYGEAEVPAILLAIYEFHRFVRGWDDIGYNFVIDLFGRIWEAREGGIDEAVVGAQAGGYNQVSTGVSVLGTFSSVVPSPAAIDALERLLAWKLSLHGAPTVGTVTVRVAASGHFYTPFASGQRVSLPRVAGHRDGDSTSCPGDAFYARLPSIRPVVARLAGTPLVASCVAVPAVPLAGEQVVVSGTLTQLGGSPVGGAPIELQRLEPGGVSTFATLTTGTDGSFSMPLVLEHSAQVRALHRPFPAAVSGLIDIRIAPRITLAVDGVAPLRVSGTVAPGKRHVTIQVWRAGGHHPRARRRVLVHGGRFATTMRAHGLHGRLLISAHTRADASNAAGTASVYADLP